MKIGNIDIKDVKLGGTQVTKIMLGGEEVWSNASVEDFIYAVTGQYGYIQKLYKSDMGQTVLMSSFAGSYNRLTNSVYESGGYVYSAGVGRLHKFDSVDLSLVGQGASGNTKDTHALWVDPVDGSAFFCFKSLDPLRIVKVNTSTMSVVTYVSTVSREPWGIVGDDTHLYVAYLDKVSKYLKSNLSLVASSPTQTLDRPTMFMTPTHIYVARTNKVYKYLKSDMSYVGATGIYGDRYALINGIWVDNGKIYVVGQFSSGSEIYYYNEETLAYLGKINDNAPTGVIYALYIDANYIFLGGDQGIYKYDKTTYAFIQHKNISQAPCNALTSAYPGETTQSSSS